MRDKPGMAFEPTLDSRMFVGAIIVHDQMQFDLPGELVVELLEKLQKLLVPMPCVALADHFAMSQFQCGKQSRRAIAFVVVGHRSTTTFLQR